MSEKMRSPQEGGTPCINQMPTVRFRHSHQNLLSSNFLIYKQNLIIPTEHFQGWTECKVVSVARYVRELLASEEYVNMFKHEPFDEWEEFHLKCCHYSVAYADHCSSHSSVGDGGWIFEMNYKFWSINVRERLFCPKKRAKEAFCSVWPQPRSPETHYFSPCSWNHAPSWDKINFGKKATISNGFFQGIDFNPRKLNGHSVSQRDSRDLAMIVYHWAMAAYCLLVALELSRARIVIRGVTSSPTRESQLKTWIWYSTVA